MTKTDWKNKPDSYWKERLSPEAYAVCRQKDTERAFTGKYYHFDEKGVYRCACCSLELFHSETKFDSGSGWPSFFESIKKENVHLKTDTSHGMARMEALCSRCGSHLGHVFDDGPAPTGKRYCINSLSLEHFQD